MSSRTVPPPSGAALASAGAPTREQPPSPRRLARHHVRLTWLRRACICICMRTTLILRDELVKKAAKLTGIDEKTALVHAGLEALIARESARRLAALGGTEPRLEVPRRRRSENH